MADINWGLWAGTLIAGGVVGATLESATGFITGVRQRRHELGLQKTEHDHLQADHTAERTHQRSLQEQSLKHDRDMKALDRRHERLRRRDSNHEDERKANAVLVAEFLDWVEYEAGTKYGPSEADWYPELSGPPTISTPDEAAAVLRGVAMTHPTKEVRDAAQTLFDSVAGHYGEILPDRSGTFRTRTEPSFKQLTDWETQAKALLEMVHQPPVDSEAGGGTG